LIIIPAYNEDDSLGQVITRVKHDAVFARVERESKNMKGGGA